MKRDYNIDTLRTIAAILVIIIHVTSYEINSSIILNDFSFNFWISNILNSFSRICVPVFLIISGMYLLKSETKSLKDFYIKRFKKIFFPFLFWMIIYLFIRFLVKNENILTIIKSVFFGFPYYHLWYFYVLIGLYLITPFLKLILNNTDYLKQRYIIVFLFILSILNSIYNSIINCSSFIGIWFLDYLGFFSLGFVIATKYFEIKQFKLILSYIINSIILVFLNFFFIKEYNNQFFYNFLNPFVIIASISIVVFFKNYELKKNVFSKYANHTFGIYLIHALILDLINYFVKILDLNLVINSFILIMIKIFITTILSLIIVDFFLKNKFLKKIV